MKKGTYTKLQKGYIVSKQAYKGATKEYGLILNTSPSTIKRHRTEVAILWDNGKEELYRHHWHNKIANLKVVWKK